MDVIIKKIICKGKIMRIKKISFSLYKMLKLSVDLKIDLKLTSNQCKELVDFIDNPLEVEEVCEWVGVVIEKSEHSKTVEYKNPHMNIKSQIDYFNPNEFKYCFTCGKPIKYVESEE